MRHFLSNITISLVILLLSWHFLDSAHATESWVALETPYPILGELDSATGDLLVLFHTDPTDNVTIRRYDSQNGYQLSDEYPIGETVTSFCYFPTSDLIYYIALDQGLLCEYSCSTKTILRTVHVGEYAISVTISNDFSKLFVCGGLLYRHEPDLTQREEDHPDYYDSRRGYIKVIDRANMAVSLSQTCYSNPTWIVSDPSDSKLYVANMVTFDEYQNDDDLYPNDLLYKLEVFDAQNLQLLSEISTGHFALGQPGGDFCLIAGAAPFSRPTKRIVLSTGSTSDVQFPTGTNILSSGASAYNGTYNKGYIILDYNWENYEFEEQENDLWVRDFVSGIDAVFPAGEHFFNQVLFDEINDVLILLSTTDNGFYLFSPAP